MKVSAKQRGEKETKDETYWSDVGDNMWMKRRQTEREWEASDQYIIGW